MSGQNRGKIPSRVDIFGRSKLPWKEESPKNGVPFQQIPPGDLFYHLDILWRKYPFNRELKETNVSGAYNCVAEFNDELRCWLEGHVLVEFPKRDIDSEWSPSMLT
jgi:hypothetical protein